MISIDAFDFLAPGEILNRNFQAAENVDAAVDAVLADVRQNGDAALRAYTKNLTGVELDALEVTAKELDAALAALDADFRETLEQAADNIRAFHAQQVHRDFALTDRPGIVMGQRYTPIERVGVCVPRSPVAFPSSVLMNVIPAKLAGVREIVLVSPPDGDGTIGREVLAAARIAGAGPGCSKSAEPRRWRRWPMARRACRGLIRSWAPAACLWPRPSARCSARWPLI